MLYKFAKFGFVMLFTAFLSSFLTPALSAAAGAVFLLGGGILCASFKKFDTVKLCCFAAAAGAILVSANLAVKYYPQKALDGVSAEVTGRVTEISTGKGRPVYTVKTDSISVDGAPQKITFKLTDWSESSIEVYDEISASVTFFTFEEEEISEVLTNRSKGMAVYVYLNSPVEVTGEYRNFPEYTIFSFREKLSSIVNRNFSGWRASFTNKILFGYGSVDTEVKDAFRSAGMSHILAISGMHLVVIMSLLERLLTRSGSKRAQGPLKTVIMMAAVLFYMALAGFGMSVMRAGFMLLASYFARLFWVKSASIDNLGLSIVAVLLIDPLACCDAGYLMSVLSSGGIILFSEPLYEKIVHKIEEKPKASLLCHAAKAFSVGFVAWTATLPVAIFAFGGLSIVAPFSNIFAGLFSQASIIFSFLGVAFGLIPFGSVISMVCATAAQFSEDILLKTAEFFGRLPFAYIYTNEIWLKLWLVGAAVIFGVPFIFKKGTVYFKHAVLMAAFVFLCGALSHEIMFAGTVRVELTALEQGTAIYLEKDGSSAVVTNGLIYDDCYKLRSGGRTAEVFISMSADTSPIELELAREFSPKIALLSGMDAVERYSGAEIVSTGEVTFWDGASIKIVSENAIEIDANGALILYIFGECDIMDIDPRFRRADIVILENVSKENYPSLRCRYLVLRKQENVLSGAEEVEILTEGKKVFVSREKNIKKGWAFT